MKVSECEVNWEITPISESRNHISVKQITSRLTLLNKTNESSTLLVKKETLSKVEAVS